jgi:hypothetical protein
VVHLELAGLLQRLAHPREVGRDILQVDRISGAALDLEQMVVHAAHERDQAVMVVPEERAELRARAAGRSRPPRPGKGEAPSAASPPSCQIARYFALIPAHSR